MTIAKMNTIMSKKSARIAKKARKQMRRLRKSAIKSSDTTTLSFTEKLIDALDKMLAAQKKPDVKPDAK